ncbi:MAG: metallopeptidase TldD-related protein [bacterium]|jgi:TldD protein
MGTKRRDFLKTSAAAAAVTLVGARVGAQPSPTPGRIIRSWAEPIADDLAADAMEAAKGAGASYVDVRIGRYRRQSVNARERQITGVSDNESYGIGVRTIVNGSWGFAATSVMTREGVAKAAREAVRIARAARSSQRRPIELAPVAAVKGTWATPVKRDPIDVPLEDKVALLIATNDAAMKAKGTRFANSGLSLLREIKQYWNSEGSQTTQTFIRVGPTFTSTAIGPNGFESYNEELAPRGQGWEYVESLDMPGNAERWAGYAVEKLGAKTVEPGRYDLILDPTNLWLTIHESIGHPTELDRAMGYEANYAGTSFVAPPDKMIGKLKYGTDIMNIQGDRTQEGSLARVGWDDEGVPPDNWLIIEKGMFKDYQTTREQSAWIAGMTGVKKSHGCSFADSWDSVQFQRMPNISLLPGEKDYVLSDIVAATDRGIVVKNRGSWSIDHQRYNFQFSGQVFYEVKGGKITGMLKDVAYQSNTPVFWNSMDMIGGKRSAWMGGSFSDGKGEPSQSNSVSHTCVPARFRNVNIVNVGRGEA